MKRGVTFCFSIDENVPRDTRKPLASGYAQGCPGCHCEKFSHTPWGAGVFPHGGAYKISLTARFGTEGAALLHHVLMDDAHKPRGGKNLELPKAFSTLPLRSKTRRQ